MRKVFLDNLPKYKDGAYKDKVNWRKSIGIKVKFIYDDIQDEIEILNYKIKKDKLDIKYKNNVFSIKTNSLLHCQLNNLFILGNKYKYNIGDIVETKFSKIKIIKQIRMPRGAGTQKGYKYECLNDGNIDKIAETSINKGCGCNVCAGRKILKGYNDLITTHPEIVKQMKYPEHAYELTAGSHTSEIFICPICGFEKEYKIYNITSKKFYCPKCSDGISYPNKIAFNLLEQLNLDFIPEYSPDWIKPKKYDFYFEINNKGYILEMDGGLGHGNRNGINGKTTEDQNKTKEVDDYKDKMAEIHNINVIRIDCLESDLEYIKNNILNSRFNDLFDLSLINWLKCHQFACDSRIKEACDLWNSGIRSTGKIAKIMKLNSMTIVRYLKNGAKINLCDYDTKEAQRESGRTNSKINKKKVVQLTLSGEFIKLWDSISEAGKKLNIHISQISGCCQNKHWYKSAGGFKWMYKEDYDKYINQQNKVS